MFSGFPWALFFPACGRACIDSFFNDKNEEFTVIFWMWGLTLFFFWYWLGKDMSQKATSYRLGIISAYNFLSHFYHEWRNIKKIRTYAKLPRLLQEGGQVMPTTVLQAHLPPDFQTWWRPCNLLKSSKKSCEIVELQKFEFNSKLVLATLEF